MEKTGDGEKSEGGGGPERGTRRDAEKEEETKRRGKRDLCTRQDDNKGKEKERVKKGRTKRKRKR